MTLTCRSQWITMPGHTINKLLTPPGFLQHTPVPHMEKSSHACRKTSDHLHAVKPVIDYSVREPHISNTHQLHTRRTEMLPTICVMHSERWRNIAVKLTALARIWLLDSSLQIWTKNRCCQTIPNNRHQVWCHGNADALEKCSPLQ